ncbi:MAG: 4-alpha-glucanotransferase, partial [Bacilli bacterium]
YNLPGMKIIQFTFDPLENNNNFEDRPNMIVYTGTHDNQTIVGWFKAQDESLQQATLQFLKKQGYNGKINWMMIAYALSSIAHRCIIPVQDLLGLDDKGRINTPGSVGSPNWEWKLTDFSELDQALKRYGIYIKEKEIYDELCRNLPSHK